MYRQVTSTQKIINSYQISETSKDNENTKNPKNEIKQSINQKQFTKETENNFTGQTIPQFQNSNNINENASNKISTYQNQTSNLDSSLQQRSTFNQSKCTCGKWKTDTNNTYRTIKSLTGTEYCTCDDDKESSIGCTCYKRNTNKTFNKALSSNGQKIFIQEGSNLDYCNCDEIEERKVFSNATSEYNVNIQNILTDDENNICTCGQRTTIHSNDTRDYNNQSNIQNTSNMINKMQTTDKSQYINQNKLKNLKFTSNTENKIQTNNNEEYTSYSELPMQTTDYEDKEINKNVTKIVNKEINIIRKEIREQIKKELNQEKENKQISWNGENYIQVIERLQFLTEEPPELRVQFLNDMMINRTINRDPIQVLIPIPNNYIQKQGVLEVLSEQKEKKEEEEKDINEDLCPENVDLLNISNAYSIPSPSFNNLEIENEEMYIAGIIKEEEPIIEEQPELEEKINVFTIENYSLYCKGNEKEPFAVENYAWDINPSERMWSGNMKLVRINKLNIEVPNKPDWNSLIEEELASRLDVEASIGDKEKERLEKERKERERKEKEKNERERKEKERKERERKEKERKERDRKEKERKKIEKRNKKKKKVKSKKSIDELSPEEGRQPEEEIKGEKEGHFKEEVQPEEEEQNKKDNHNEEEFHYREEGKSEDNLHPEEGIQSREEIKHEEEGNYPGEEHSKEGENTGKRRHKEGGYTGEDISEENSHHEGESQTKDLQSDEEGKAEKERIPGEDIQDEEENMIDEGQEEEREEDIEEIEEIEVIEEVEQKSERDIEKERERERKRKEKELRKKRKDQKNFRTKKFSLTYKENKKQFKKIDIGDNEIITLKAVRRVLQKAKKPEKILKQSDKTNIVLGGSGFDINKYKWAPVPFNAQSMTIEKTKIETPLENITTDKIQMLASTKRRQNWNLVNNLSSESTINILTKEKKLLEQKIRPLTVLGDVNKKNKWNNKIRKQKGIKLGFSSTKKWYLKICKENDILYEQESDDVIINDDYNNVKGPEMRPITATIIKVNEEEETSSVSSYDVFQNLIIKKSNYEFDYGSTTSLLRNKNGLQFTLSNGSLGGNFGVGLRGSNFMNSGVISMGKNSFRDIDKKIIEERYKYTSFPSISDEKKNMIKLRFSNENLQKNQFDKNVKSLVNQTNNLIGNINSNENMDMNAGNMKIINGINIIRASNSRDNNLAGNINMNNNMNTSNMNVKVGMTTVRTSGSQDNNLMGNINSNNGNGVGSMKVSGMRINNMRNTKKIIGEKRKKIEFLREDPEERNYLQI